MCYMRYPAGEVGVRELRQNLSVYLRRVKEGATLEVKERGTECGPRPVGAHSSVRTDSSPRAGPVRRGDLLGLPVGRLTGGQPRAEPSAR
jgi:antitoxin (DNA-binding transcriptional repressor) of toxin-antitoxin stability system